MCAGRGVCVGGAVRRGMLRRVARGCVSDVAAKCAWGGRKKVWKSVKFYVTFQFLNFFVPLQSKVKTNFTVTHMLFIPLAISTGGKSQLASALRVRTAESAVVICFAHSSNVCAVAHYMCAPVLYVCACCVYVCASCGLLLWSWIFDIDHCTDLHTSVLMIDWVLIMLNLILNILKSNYAVSLAWCSYEVTVSLILS